jgi:hypothetical protein
VVGGCPGKLRGRGRSATLTAGKGGAGITESGVIDPDIPSSSAAAAADSHKNKAAAGATAIARYMAHS